MIEGGIAMRWRLVRRCAQRIQIVMLCLAAASGAGPARLPAPADLPREYVETDTPQPAGRTIHVPAGADLQGALNTARLGDIITLQAGATYTGPFLLPRKEGTEWLTVRTDAADARLQSGGSRRVNPALASAMPRLVASRAAVVSLAPGAHHYRFLGVEMSPTPGTFLYHLVGPATDPQSEADQPHHLVVDRSYLHGDPARGTRRGIVLNGRYIAVIHSHLSDFKEVDADSQALCGWNGSGPFKIVDNYLEGAAENLMFGGADPRIRDLVPSDVEIRGNTFAKNVRWNPRNAVYDGSRWTMKNLLELKNARRVLVEGNVFENFEGAAIVITPRNQSGTAPWSTVEDVTIRNNWIRRVRSVLVVSGFDEYHPSQPTRRVTFEQNVAESLHDSGEPNPKMILVNQGPDDVAILHNTILTPAGLGSSYLLFANAQTRKGNAFAFNDNIVHMGSYGLGAESPGLGNNSVTLLDGHVRAWLFTGNLLINSQGASTGGYPPGQHVVTSLNAVGFTDAARLDLRLGAQSRYKRVATDGRDPGANLDGLRDALTRFMSVPDPVTQVGR